MVVVDCREPGGRQAEAWAEEVLGRQEGELGDGPEGEEEGEAGPGPGGEDVVWVDEEVEGGKEAKGRRAEEESVGERFAGVAEGVVVDLGQEEGIVCR